MERRVSYGSVKGRDRKMFVKDRVRKEEKGVRGVLYVGEKVIG